MERNTVGIIGTGWVGTSVAMATLQAGVAGRLWLHDVRGEVAEGEALDLAHGAAFYPACDVQAVSLERMREADVVVVASGRNGRPGESRLDLLRDNARMSRDIGRALAGFPGRVVMVSNPVDVLTRVLQQASGLPPERVIGTGTMLDSARLRQMLARRLQLAPASIHSQVVGEHGDSSVVLWSSAHLGGLPLRAWPHWSRDEEPDIARQMRGAAYEIIRRKGATNHAIGLVTARLLAALLRDEQRLLTVSRVQVGLPGLPGLSGLSGLTGVALSLPCRVGRQGATDVYCPAMNDDELAGLHASAKVLQAAWATLDCTQD